MNNKLLTRIFLFFSLTILLFASIVGCIFFYLYSTNIIASYRSDFLSKTEAIAHTLSLYFEKEFPKNYIFEDKLKSQIKHANLGLGLYLNFMDDIALSNIWIVDSHTQTIHVEFGKYNISYSSIPSDVRELIDASMQGQTVFSERQGTSLINRNFVITSPITLSDGTIFAAVVLHARSKQMPKDILQACYVLIGSLLVAIIASFIPAYCFAKKLVNPLKKMATTTSKMTLGHYTVQTGVNQNDEVGMLAKNIDILAIRLAETTQEQLELEQLRKIYISNISHELRTPVAVVRCSLEALCDNIITNKDTIAHYHHEMLHEVIHLDRLINDLLELSRLQSPSYLIAKEKINFICVVEDAIKTCTPLACKNNLTIEFDTNTSLFIMYGDFGRLRQMLVTILDNAIKFSTPCMPIAVNVVVTDDHCLTRITNHGVGIEPENLPYIFKEYYTQLGKSNPNGTGLGLAIAKHIADRHHLLISVESIPNQHTTFSLYI